MNSLQWTIFELAYAVDSTRRRAEIQRRRQRRAIMRKELRPLEIFSEAELLKTFRFRKETLKSLIEELSPLLPQPRRHSGISSQLKVLIALTFYATGSYQTLIGQSTSHNVSQKSVSRAVREVTEALNSPIMFEKYIKWPVQPHDRNNIKARFYEKFGIPGVIGCIDGTHIALIRPKVHEERYFNRKGYHSLNAMIICDADLNILWVDASNPGASHDSRVWNNSPLNQQLNQLIESGEQVFLLGDSGYALRRTMMTPIIHSSPGTAEHNYYVKHVHARNTVERCIGVLKARFRCLLAARALHYDPVTSGKITQACCVLHNIALIVNAPAHSFTAEEAEEEAQQLPLGENVTMEENNPRLNSRVNPELMAGRAMQRRLINYLWSYR